MEDLRVDEMIVRQTAVVTKIVQVKADVVINHKAKVVKLLAAVKAKVQEATRVKVVVAAKVVSRAAAVRVLPEMAVGIDVVDTEMIAVRTTNSFAATPPKRKPVKI